MPCPPFVRAADIGAAVAAWKQAARRTDPAAFGTLCRSVLTDTQSNAMDSGEGRSAAIGESVPIPFLGATPYECSPSCGEDGFADKLLSALRFHFGGSEEKDGEMTATTANAQ